MPVIPALRRLGQESLGIQGQPEIYILDAKSDTVTSIV